MLDNLMQGALVDLFEAYGVALAPLPRAGAEAPRSTHLSAAIAFSSAREQTGPVVSGRLTMALPPEVLELMKHGATHGLRHADWTRELVNQLMGRIKNRLLAFGVHLQAGLPVSVGRELLDTQLERGSGLRVYRGRTLRGDIVATLEGTLKDSELVFRGHPTVSEGDLIIF
jgi:hypothetical protein